MKGNLLAAMVLLLLQQSIIAQQAPTLLSLEDCIDIALENNLNVKRSELNLEGNKINLVQARANQLPSVNLNGNSGFNWGRSINPTTNQFITQQFAFSSAGGNAGVTLFNGMQLSNTVRQNKVLLEASEMDLEEAKNIVSINITTFYLNVIFNRELVENARFQLESSTEQLDRTKKLVAIGSLARTSELDLIAQVATNEVNLINAQNSLDLALLNLKQAMLIPSSTKIEIVVPEIELTDVPGIESTAESIFGTASGLMPEIKSADLGVESAQIGVRVASGSAMPTLSLGGGFNTNYSNAFRRFSPDPDNPFTFGPTGAVTSGGEQVLAPSPNGSFEVIPFNDQFSGNLSRNLGMSLQIPIFNGLRNRSNIQRSKISLQQAEITAIERRNTLRQQIETSYNDAVAASKTYAASRRQVEALEESYRAIKNQYELGAANSTEFQVSNNNLFGAKSDLVRAKYDFIFKLKILDFYQGKPLSFN